jgi:hypothetical protein
MKFRLIKFNLLFLFSFLLFNISIDQLRAESLPQRLSGKILLQVESAGEAWYVNPLNQKRYYLGRPDDAFTLMRELGLGVSENNYQKFSSQGAASFKGRILLRAEASGEAYYVNPDNAKLYYLGRPADAFNLMRQFGLGISNSNLNLIPAHETSLKKVVETVIEKKTTETAVNFKNNRYNWRYQDKDYSLDFKLSSDLYNSYSSSPKVYSYYLGEEPLDFRDSFYAMFLKVRTDDKQSLMMLEALKTRANSLGLSSDERVAFIMSFVQHLNYDTAKVDTDLNNPYYPFETLYLQRGICSDTTFLAVLWLRELGYGAAILDFPDSKHSAAGIACPLSESLNSSGYCFIETTNYFPTGVVPAAILDGQASESETNFSNLFSVERLGKMEIKQASFGKVYQGVSVVREEANALNQLKLDLNRLEAELKLDKELIDSDYDLISAQQEVLLGYQAAGNISTYNQAVPAYNELVKDYQVKTANYQILINNYNKAIGEFNSRYRSFYQQ